MRSILTIALKDLRLLWRDKFGMFWVLVFPLLMAVFFGSLMSGMGRQSPVHVAVVDEDQSDLSKAFAAKFGESEAVDVETLAAATESTTEGSKHRSAGQAGSGATDGRGSTTLTAASAAVQNGRIAAYVRLKPGFGKSGFVPDSGKVEIGVDPARRVEAGLLQGVVMEAVFAPMREMFSSPSKIKSLSAKWLSEIDAANWPADRQAELAALQTLLKSYDRFASLSDEKSMAAGSPFSGDNPTMVEIAGRRQRPTSGYEISFPQSITWGIFGCVSAFAMSLVTERTFGTYLRLRVSPVTRGQILAGKGLACFLACILISGFLLLLGRLVFGVRVLDPAKLLVAVAASSACFVGLMMFTSVLGRTERAVAGSVWAILMPLAMVGGSMVPQIAMPQWMQSAGSVSPVRWAIRSLEGAIWRDLPWSDILMAGGVLLAMGAVFYAIGLAVLLKYDG
jgi:ABC-2 type transport system permease protein